MRYRIGISTYASQEAKSKEEAEREFLAAQENAVDDDKTLATELLLNGEITSITEDPNEDDDTSADEL